MRKTILLLSMLAPAVLLAVPASAQSDPPAAPAPAAQASDAAGQDKPAQDKAADDEAAAHKTDFQTGELNIQLQARPDVESSKFQEYRDVVRGVSIPAFRLFGSDGGLRFDLRGQNVKQLDERYTGYLKTDLFRVSADYNSIVHRIGNDGRTMLVQQTPGVWRMSPTLQQTFQNIWESTTNANRVFTTFVAPLFTPSIQDGNTVNVQVLRERTDIVVDMAPNEPYSAKVNYRREQRHGSGGLSSNYISYQIETPSVTEYLTQDVGFDGSITRPWGNVHAGLHYNWFTDQVPSLVFDNPFRATDALSVTVGTGAAATGVGGPAEGRMVNPPSNSEYITAFGTTLKVRAPYTHHGGRESGSHGTERSVLSVHDQYRRGHAGSGGPDVIAAGAVVERQDQHELSRAGHHVEAGGAAASRAALPALRSGQPDAADYLPGVRQLGSDMDRRRAHQRAVQLYEQPARRHCGLRHRQTGDARRRVPQDHHRSHVPRGPADGGEFRERRGDHARRGYGEPPRDVRERPPRLQRTRSEPQRGRVVRRAAHGIVPQRAGERWQPALRPGESRLGPRGDHLRHLTR